MRYEETFSLSPRGELCRWFSRFGELVIRAAVPSDGDRIAEIAALVNIHNYAQFNRGFLFYSLTTEEYARRIIAGHIVHVFALDDEMVGFVCGMDQVALNEAIVVHERLAAARGLPLSDIVSRTVRGLAADSRHDNYLFVDQIALLPEWQNLGLGEQFAWHFSQLHRRRYYIDLLESPLRNPRIQYWHRRGFIKVGEVRERPPERFVRQEGGTRALEHLTWGIYTLPALAFKPIRFLQR